MTNEQSRAAFERALRKSDFTEEVSMETGPHDTYLDDRLYYIFFGWKLHKAQQAQPAHEPCAKQMREAGKPSPRTCPTCGLGPCSIAQQAQPVQPVIVNGLPVAAVIEMAAHYVERGDKSTILAGQLRRINHVDAQQGRDSLRLDFMMKHEAWIAWNREGDACRLFVNDEDGTRPYLGWKCKWSQSGRDAIDAALEKGVKK